MWETLRKEEVLQNLKTDQRMGLTKEEIQAKKTEIWSKQIRRKKKETFNSKVF